MADRKITDLTALAAGSQATGDLLTIVDVSEAAATDKNKKITVESLFKGIPGDVGIGTSSPDSILAIAGTGSDAATRITITDGSGVAEVNGRLGNLVLDSDAANAVSGSFMRFKVDNSEALRIDSSGRVLIGTTSSVSSGGGDLLEVASGVGNILITSTNSTRVADQACGQLRFWGKAGANEELAKIAAVADGTHGSGDKPTRLVFSTTADGASSPTERMRIDSSGNVGIGTAAPSQQLHIASANTSTSGTIIASDSQGRGVLIESPYIGNSVGKIGISGTDSALAFGSGSSNSERMRIDSSGNVGIGTTSPNGLLTVQANSGRLLTFRNSTTGTGSSDGSYIALNGSDLQISNAESAPITFYTGDTERMRFTSNGYLKAAYDGGYINATGLWHEFTGNQANAYSFRVTCDNATPLSHYISELKFSATAPNNGNAKFMQCADSGGARINLDSDGGIHNYQSNDGNLCDEREKKNIVSLDTKWDKVKSWELKKFHYNEDADTDDLRYGVIAQQVEEHCPEVLTDWIKQRAEDAVLDDDGNVVTPAVPEVIRKGVKEQQMMWMAIKALQEAQARIETLEASNADLLARVTALEAG